MSLNPPPAPVRGATSPSRGEVREETSARHAVGSSNLDEGGSIVRGQSLDGFGAYADVAVAVLGAEKICNPHGQGGNLCGLPSRLKRSVGSPPNDFYAGAAPGGAPGLHRVQARIEAWASRSRLMGLPDHRCPRRRPVFDTLDECGFACPGQSRTGGTARAHAARQERSGEQIK